MYARCDVNTRLSGTCPDQVRRSAGRPLWVSRAGQAWPPASRHRFGVFGFLRKLSAHRPQARARPQQVEEQVVACAAEWPALTVSAKAYGKPGVRASFRVRTKRKDGRWQVTYNATRGLPEAVPSASGSPSRLGCSR